MARRGTPTPEAPVEEHIVDIDVADEMQGSFLEYAYSVIYSRALPDARDGLKPVQRRILYGMSQMGLSPDRGHVKSSRVVGDVMGKLHPHGDQAIYDALVRMAQPFSMRVPLVDGHGNFGSLDDGPAAMRYTESRLAPPATLLTGSLDEDVVDFGPNYDDRETEPLVLPAAFPNLLVNGAAGIAVGMATNMPPHNLGEVIAAARHLIAHPKATLDDLMRFVPGPDLPTGGKIIGLDGVREAYESGRGTFRTRATARIENVTSRKKGIVVTELPYTVGPERVVEKIADLVRSKKLQGISAVTDLTDGEHGLQLVIEIKNGFHPEAILEQLYRLTPMEDSFGINNVALVEGRPRALGLRELLSVYVDHRIDVVRRRTEHRRAKAADRLHIVDGLLIALDAIDDVIHVIRSSNDAAEAKARLREAFELSDVQAQHILDMPLRRLTSLEVDKLRAEQATLRSTIEELTALLEDEKLLRKLVSDELADVAKKHATPRRTVLLESSGQTSTAASAVPLEVADDPCHVLLSSTGLLARTADDTPLPADGSRAKHDVVLSAVPGTARGEVGVVTSRGRVIRLAVLDLPALPPTAGTPSLAGGGPVAEFVTLDKGERALALTTLRTDSPGLALGTAQGVVKRVVPEVLTNRDSWDVVSLKDGDEVVGAVELTTGEEELVFITSDAQLLHFGASGVRPQGRAAGGMAGVRLATGARVVFFGALDPDAPALVVTVSGSSDALPGTEPGSGKVTPFDEYPAKGRATGGVRCHRFLKGEDELQLAWVGAAPARAASANGVAVDLPLEHGRRDGSGVVLAHPVAAVASPANPPAAPAPSSPSPTTDTATDDALMLDLPATE
jgi:DNA gyrase subunit A